MKRYVTRYSRLCWMLEEIDNSVVRIGAQPEFRYPLRRVLAVYTSKAEAERAARYYESKAHK